MKRNFLVTLVALAWLFVSAVQAAVVLSDDFNGESLDLSKWKTLTPAGGSVTQGGGVATTAADGRSYLITVGQWTPTPAAPIQVTGTVTIPSGYFEVWSRAVDTADSLGLPNSGGVLGAGIRAGFYAPTNDLGVLEKDDGVWPWTAIPSTGTSVSDASPQTWDFILTDDGSNISFTITAVGNPLNTATQTATTAFSSGQFHIAFNGNPGIFDNIVITQVPEPATIVLAVDAAALGVFAVRGRRRKS